MNGSLVLVVEDETAIAELMAIHLRHAGFRVAHCGTAEEAMALVDQGELPALAVLDWMLPGKSGLQLCRQWRQSPRTRELPIVMVTARAEEADLVHALDSGSDDYVAKPFSPSTLVARVKAVLRRRAPHDLDEVVRVAQLKLDPASRRVFAAEPGQEERPIRLGPTEFKLLHFLMTHPERVHSRGALLDQVWGDHVFIEERTVDVHVKRLREALAPSGQSGVIETVRGAGYRFVATAGAALPRSAEAAP